MSPWLTTKHQNSQQSLACSFNKLWLFWKEVGFCPFPVSHLSFSRRSDRHKALPRGAHLNRQLDPEAAALARFGVDADAATHQFNGFADRRQA